MICLADLIGRKAGTPSLAPQSQSIYRGRKNEKPLASCYRTPVKANNLILVFIFLSPPSKLRTSYALNLPFRSILCA
ncbi:hypothetical protein BU25DRAFT_23734 [Macroventuria anomochaeta]|uniref:Uncharacterized protein n=1 Tax=Macroventuria anomochaeta TaxID=301207 RepID=A0ACB6S423_9PLEO|nr:uncharacterized protein BU25DRAFT_23734 [Macroventuria anomochaeta]KAF2628921.1 hypothetical protein BU25DRAFT_23734 [Macroventuria anomochaeta]